MCEEKTIHDVEVPGSINPRQVALAKAYVSERLQEGFTINDFCKKNSISTKTWYKWTDSPEYNDYINNLSDVLLPEDELQAVRKMKSKIMGLADKEKVSANELKIFMETFSYVFEAEARMQAEKLGLNKGVASVNNRPETTLEEKKAYLITKLTKPLTSEEERELDEKFNF
ncbi:hypothetical protein C2I27_16555 [Priestia megaterium]|uniref:phBC6A51 family helix-turn-helix protein n=1 Tax=Priestia megaterium TaxID=1404 RepID=UPI000D50FA0F|nr:phBC6A51 family helix-turn-helix protein [Priestia megaterium]MCM3546589.1 phBC6A51 family helix-turn-helix protein [Priestia megaterium]PVC67417.1 hypothetical protein C2I27_16555 [Priestia megaterium]